MPQTLLLVHADPSATQPLADYFTQRGDRVVLAATALEALKFLSAQAPELVSVDLHLPGDDWLDIIRMTRRVYPAARVLITSRVPDLRRELQAKELGCQVFLRQPFAPVWIERALAQLTSGAVVPRQPAALPAVRLSVRAKIILPFALLAGVFAAAAAYLIGTYVSDSMRDRFDRQLVDAATLTGDWMVRTENALLETERLVANSTGVAAALAARDSQALQALVLPLAINNQPPALELLAADGVSVLSLRQAAGAPSGYAASQGEGVFAQWPLVQSVLAQRQDPQGDKYASLAEAPWGRIFYVAGPVWGPEDQLAGVVLVGMPLDALAREIRASTLAHVTFYTAAGRQLASTLAAGADLSPAETNALAGRAGAEVLLRPLTAESAVYSEAVGPWSARNGEALGWAGTALAQSFIAQPSFLTQAQSLAVVLAGLLLVFVIGWSLAQHITRPLGPMVRAARDVAQGNFQVKLHDSGNDEVAVLVYAFNQMVSGLQEGSIYRDLLGRTVSPEVREELRTAFESGNLRLEGQAFTATVLMSDIRGFTTLSEKSDPTVVLKWLNEYFSELVPVITANGGVVDKFEGDAILAFFGVLPRPLPPRESAFQACRAALEMLRVIETINARRAARGEPLFITGIGVNTGPVTAGGLGTSDRLNYTIIGDTVNTTQRLEAYTRAFDQSAAVISESTWAALRGRQSLFQLDSLGGHMFKGKSEPIQVYHLRPADESGA